MSAVPQNTQSKHDDEPPSYSRNVALLAEEGVNTSKLVDLAVEPLRIFKRQTRAGAPNYTTEDIDALLDCVSAVLPLGSNHWALVANKFSLWAKENERPVRDQDSIRNKFDKLANAKKRTGDPSCPSTVRKAKHIARDIENKCAARVLGSDVEKEDTNDAESFERGGTCVTEKIETVGKYVGKRRMGSTGLSTPSKMSKTDSKLVEHVGQISGHIGKISEFMSRSALKEASSMTKEDVKAVVKAEISKSLQSTNHMLESMAEMLRALTKSGCQINSSNKPG